MTLYIDIENKKLVQSLTSDRTVATPIFMQGDNEPLILHLLEKGEETLYKEKALVVGTDFLCVAIARFSGDPKYLTYASGYTLNAESVAEVVLPLNTTAIENAVQDNESISAFLEVEYSNTDGRIVTVLQTACRVKNDLIDNAPTLELQERFQSFQTACETAKSYAEDAATTATEKASEAGESASAAAASADAASISAQDSNDAKNTAVEAKEAAEASATNAANAAGAAAVYSEDCGAMLNTATNAANLAQEVSRIAIVPITATTQTIQPNKCYTLLTNDVDAYTLTPEMPSGDPEYLLQAVVQLKTGSTAPVINWGGNPSFFNNRIPTINANSSDDVIFEFDNITLSWSVGVMKK